MGMGGGRSQWVECHCGRGIEGCGGVSERRARHTAGAVEILSSPACGPCFHRGDQILPCGGVHSGIYQALGAHPRC